MKACITDTCSSNSDLTVVSQHDYLQNTLYSFTFGFRALAALECGGVLMVSVKSWTRNHAAALVLDNVKSAHTYVSCYTCNTLLLYCTNVVMC